MIPGKHLTNTNNYITNQTKGDCVTVGIHNALTWAGGKRDYALIGHVCHINPITGLAYDMSNNHIFTKTLRLLIAPWLTLQVRKNPTVKNIDNHLTSGGSVLLFYKPNKYTGHATFISKKTSINYVVWNYPIAPLPKNNLRIYIPHRRLKSILSLSRESSEMLPRAFLFHRRSF